MSFLEVIHPNIIKTHAIARKIRLEDPKAAPKKAKSMLKHGKATD